MFFAIQFHANFDFFSRMVERIDGWDNPRIVLKTLRLKLLETNGRGHLVLTSHSNVLPYLETHNHFRLVKAVLYVSVSGSCCCSRASVW